jgi:hypothetical protein
MSNLLYLAGIRSTALLAPTLLGFHELLLSEKVLR